MNKPVVILLIVLLLFLLFGNGNIRGQVREQIPGPLPEQPRTDTFEYAGIGSLQPLNPVTVKAKSQRSVNYQLLVMPGCMQGSIISDMQQLGNSMTESVQFNLVRNDGFADFTIRVNCGTDHVRICSSVNIFCLGRNFPYTPDVEISDIMYAPVAWPLMTRLSILCHEICGHAIGTWNEQYCPGGSTSGPCKGLALFTSTPGWIDFMNTGPNSRHLWNVIEINRWRRTMYELNTQVPTCDGGRIDWGAYYDTCRGLLVGDGAWDFNLATGGWQDKQGQSEWCCEQGYGGRYNRRLDVWEWTHIITENWRNSDPVWRCVSGCS